MTVMRSRLSDKVLPSISEAKVPAYDRSRIAPGIVHLGIGAFHRAHQAVYVDDCLAAGDTGWGIIGASLRSPATRDALEPQNGLYTLAVRGQEQEQLRVVLLDTKHRILGARTVYQGSVNQAQVRIGEIYRDAVRQNATAIVAVHNHPSGDPTPSLADIDMTKKIIQAGEKLGVLVHDHLIIGKKDHVSFRSLQLI